MVVETEDSSFIMKKYFLCILMNGPYQQHTPAEVLQLQVAHLQYIYDLTDAGIVVMSGPLEVAFSGNKRGILLFDTETMEEAEAWACNDPMVRVSRMEYEVIPWWTAKGVTLP